MAAHYAALVGVLTYEHIPFAVLILVSSLQAIRRTRSMPHACSAPAYPASFSR
jgi:ABC-type spermidine/putrescine transport system permease subunit I